MKRSFNLASFQIHARRLVESDHRHVLCNPVPDDVFVLQERGQVFGVRRVLRNEERHADLQELLGRLPRMRSEECSGNSRKTDDRLKR